MCHLRELSSPRAAAGSSGSPTGTHLVAQVPLHSTPENKMLLPGDFFIRKKFPKFLEFPLFPSVKQSCPSSK